MTEIEHHADQLGSPLVAPASENVAATGQNVLKRLFPLSLALILVSATLWSIWVFGFTIHRDYLMQPDEVVVPNVVKLEIKEAFAAMEKAGLKLQVHESRYDKKVPKRIVLSQDPGAKKKVRQGRTILVVVSLGPELIEVPKFVGTDLRSAKITISNNKLTVGNISFTEPEYDQDEEILKQVPPAGKEVPRGEPVHLTVRRAWR